MRTTTTTTRSSECITCSRMRSLGGFPWDPVGCQVRTRGTPEGPAGSHGVLSGKSHGTPRDAVRSRGGFTCTPTGSRRISRDGMSNGVLPKNTIICTGLPYMMIPLPLLCVEPKNVLESSFCYPFYCIIPHQKCVQQFHIQFCIAPMGHRQGCEPKTKNRF